MTDEQSKSRQSCSDALGRITQVTEDPGSPTHPGYLTYYHYNPMEDLTCVTQGGSNDANSNPASEHDVSAICPASSRVRITVGYWTTTIPKWLAEGYLSRFPKSPSPVTITACRCCAAA